MIEEKTNIFYTSLDAYIGITTNGSIKSNGRLVMGRGTALQAKTRYKDLDKILADHIREFGNTMCFVETPRRLFSFPVKHHWNDKQADIELITRSANTLFHIAMMKPNRLFYLPRPGCGCGRLSWSQVKPIIEFLPDNVIVVTL